MADRTALLIIDVQQGLVDEGPWNFASVLANIETLLSAARAAGAQVIFVRDVRVEPGLELAPSLVPAPDEPVVDKGFCNALLDTDLQQQLGQRGIGKAVVVGMQTDYCIDSTCRAVAAAGYEVQLVREGHTTFSTDTLEAEQIVAHHNHILRELAAGAGSVQRVPLSELCFARGTRVEVL
ncbi:isochorismatase family protein [Pseudenhygromyxa sp. WMMC2535]|uniref:isochorismatase family protein n=1 Tax=Pseudenhygromyxa sp. WMMC2535 TaxID=2712867 RepID=UPI00155780E7|nr:isochorismatase family protein [Pseudenhygromyxa sp. WMMC2535]